MENAKKFNHHDILDANKLYQHCLINKDEEYMIKNLKNQQNQKDGGSCSIF